MGPVQIHMALNNLPTQGLNCHHSLTPQLGPHRNYSITKKKNHFVPREHLRSVPASAGMLRIRQAQRVAPVSKRRMIVSCLQLLSIAGYVIDPDTNFISFY